MPEIPSRTCKQAVARNLAPPRNPETVSVWPPSWMPVAAPSPPVESTKSEPEPTGEDDPAWTPRRPPAKVAEIGRWPIPWRRRWGELSNQFEDEGVPFPESERHAYHQVKAEMKTP